MDGFRFPKGFELGVSSASTQIEGGDIDNNWMDWYRKGNIKDGSSPAVANEHWDRWQEDDQLMADMGIKHARIGLEWVRIEPECGVFDKEGMQHYIDELKFMRSKGIEPLVTLHHFSDPCWFTALGGWEKYENVDYWCEFVEYVVRELGSLCTQYITINEPNVYAMSGWFDGTFPPGKKNIALYFEVLSNMAAAHVRAYKLIHELNAAARVSAAMHICTFATPNSNPIFMGIAGFAEYSFQTAITKAMARGIVGPLMKKRPELVPGEYCDFWGLNFYSRQTISGFEGGTMPGSRINDLGWEIIPGAIAITAKFLYDTLPREIYVTENGTCDNEDKWRSRYIYDHIRVLLGSQLPVKRYYHWCFVDNFEWCDGESARFGLVHIDYRTQKRTIKRSGHFYSEMIKAGGCTQELYDKYVAGIEYKEQ